LGDTHYRSNLVFVSQAGNTGGLCYGELWQHDTATPVTISSINTPATVVFRNNGASRNTLPDVTNNRIEITHGGVYMVNISAGIKSVGAGPQQTEYHAHINGVEASNLHVHRRLGGGGNDLGAISMSGIVVMSEGDFIQMTVTNNTSSDNLIVEDANLSIFQIGAV
jgi:hypothetical protein